MLVGGRTVDGPRAAPRRHRSRAASTRPGERAPGVGAGHRPVGRRAGRARSTRWSPARPAATGPRPRCSACTAARTPPTRTASPPSAPPGSTPGSSSSRSTTAARRATARRGATRSRAARAPPSSRTSPRCVDRLVADGVVDRRGAWWRAGHGAATWRCSRAGTQPQRWAAGVAGVPVADYLAAYEDEMEQLRAFDRALFGGSPAGAARAATGRRRRSPTSTRCARRCSLLAGENDPRCPIRQIDNYLDALAERGDETYEVRRFDAGHGIARRRADDPPHRHRDRLRAAGAGLSELQESHVPAIRGRERGFPASGTSVRPSPSAPRRRCRGWPSSTGTPGAHPRRSRRPGPGRGPAGAR